MVQALNVLHILIEFNSQVGAIIIPYFQALEKYPATQLIRV